MFKKLVGEQWMADLDTLRAIVLGYQDSSGVISL